MTWAYKKAILARIKAPGRLKRVTGESILYPFLKHGVKMEPCPVCEGKGWLYPRLLVFCPVCHGFKKVSKGHYKWLMIFDRTYGRRNENGSEGNRS